MLINIKELLDFLDDKKDSQKGDANAIISILGEELNASVYRHYRENKVEILDDSVLPGTSKGNRLDRWIIDEGNKILYQCEIKNWAATAIGGKQLESEVDDEKTLGIVRYYWKREINNNLSPKAEHPNGVTKVLLKMKPPEKYQEGYKIEPLLIYWMPVSSKGTLSPLSSVSVESLKLPIDSNFSILHIFSVSLYLRQLYKNGKGLKSIDLDMSHLERRIRILNKLQHINF